MKPKALHQYRLAKNNPFQGEEWVLFANPKDPESPVDPKATPEGQNPEQGGETPKQGEQNPEQTGDAIQIPRPKEQGTVARELREILPGRDIEDENERLKIQTHWMGLLGDYNGIQHQIGIWEERKKKIEERTYVFENPDFNQELRKEYQQLIEEMRKLGIPLSKKSRDTIERKIKEKDDDVRGDIIRIFEAAIVNAVIERNERLQEIVEEMVGDIKERLINLKNNWEQNPPEGYEDVAEGWRNYCLDLIQALEDKDFSALMSKEPNFPDGNDDGSQAYKDAKNWWYAVMLMEDSFKDFKEQKDREYSQEKLEEQFSGLEHKLKSTLTPEVEKAYEERLDDLISEVDKTITLLEQKEKDVAPEDKEMRKSELFKLKKDRENLLKKKGIRKQFEDALYKEELVPVERVGIKVDLPKGIKGAIQFAKELPLYGDGHLDKINERRLVLRSLSEAMLKVDRSIDKVKQETDVYLVQSVENLRNARTNIEFQQGRPRSEVIWINPFETFGHLWHSVTETIKGNVETEAKRGAGYFQKEVTKFMEKMPNPTGFPGSQVFQSFRELSSNGQQEAEHAEHGRVGDIEKGYKGFNTEHLLHIASSTDVRWEFKACLNILAERGRINWYSDWIFKQLNKWQTAIPLPEDPNWHMKNITASDDMMRRAFLYIYRITDDYKDLKNKNNGAYESKKSEFMKGFGQVAAERGQDEKGESIGGLKRLAEVELNKFIQDHHAGIHFSTADPIKYEAVIHYAIEQGKMNGEDRLYYINKGIAEGFLPFDRGAELTKLNNTYPPVDLYDTSSGRAGRPTITDIKEWAAYDSVAHVYWMHDHVFYNPAVQQRLTKTVLQGASRIDHDDAPMVAGYFDAAGMEKMLKANGSGGYGLPITGLQSFSEGHQFWLDMFAERKEKMGREEANTEITRFGAMFIRYEAILKNRMKKGAGSDYYRLDDEIGRAPSRTAGIYGGLFGRGEVTMNARLEGIKKYLWMLDYNTEAPFIKRLTSGYYSTDEQMKADVEKLDGAQGANGAIWGNERPATMDQAFERINKYISYVAENKPGRVEALVSKLKMEHDENDKKILKEREEAKKEGSATWENIKTLKMRLKEAEIKQQAIREEANELAHGRKVEHHGHGDHGDHGHGGHGGHGDDHGHGEHGGEHGHEAHGAHHRAANNSDWSKWVYDEDRQETRRAA